MLNLAGQVVFITGASRGIGAAAVDAFVGAGARVVLFARNHTAMKEVAQPFGENVCVIQGDVSQADDINAAIIKAQAHFGRLDVLINNAATLDPISHQDGRYRPMEQVDRRECEGRFLCQPCSATHYDRPREWYDYHRGVGRCS